MKAEPSRASINAITLLNFNGIQFEHLAVDPATTSLEGSNGAGKTTTMVGTYLPLMPDKNFLKFKNITDNSSQIKSETGLHERLGRSGDISYSIMSITLSDGKQVHIGIEVQKRPQRQYELMPFLVYDVPAGLAPEELWMVRDKEGEHCIAPLTHLLAHIVSLGANLRKFSKLPEYFQMLYEWGITPSLMTTASDRSKFHKLMMASFYGGLTTDLQKSIKDYLLPENRDIATTVERARSLLREVKTTRQNISHAQEIYSRVQSIDRCAFTLMASVYYNLSNWLDNSYKEMVKCRDGFRQQKKAYQACRLRVAELSEQRACLKLSLEGANAALKNAEQYQGRVVKAHDCAQRMVHTRVRAKAMREVLGLAENACDAAALQQRTDEERQLILLKEQRSLAISMGNARIAFEQISRKVGLYNGALRALTEARATPGLKNLNASGADAAIVEQREILATARAALEPVRRSLQHAEDVAAAFKPVHVALETLAAHPLAAEQAFSAGQLVLAQFREMADQVRTCIGIEERIRIAISNSRRQEGVRKALALLTSADEVHIRSSDELAAAILDFGAQADGQWQRLEEEQARAQRAMTDLQEAKALTEQLRALLAQWTETDRLCAQLEELSGFRATDASGLQQQLTQVKAKRLAVQGQCHHFSDLVDQASAAMMAIQDNGSRMDERLSILADKVGGRLVSECYDDVVLEHAARVEASMGPLLEAISVPDVQRAAITLAADPSPPDAVWLVADDDIGAVPSGEFVRDLCMVKLGIATRLSAIPIRPVLGRAAREVEIVRLSKEIDLAEAQRQEAATRLQGLDRQLAILDALLPLRECLVLPSPQGELQAAIESVVQRERQIADAMQAGVAAKAKGAALRALLMRLQACSADSSFIDGDDWTEVRHDLDRQHRLGDANQRQIDAVSVELRLVQQGLDVLRTLPIDAGTVAQRERAKTDLEARIEQTNVTLDLLESLKRQSSYFEYADQVALEQQHNGVLSEIAAKEQTVALEVEAARQAVQASMLARRRADEARNTDHANWQVESVALQALEAEFVGMDCPGDAQALVLAREAVGQADIARQEVMVAYDSVVESFGGASNQLVSLYVSLTGHAAGVRPAGAAASLLGQARNATRQLIRIRSDWMEFGIALKAADVALCQRLTQPAVAEEYQAQSYVSLGTSLGRLRQELLDVLVAAKTVNVLPQERATRSGKEYLHDWTAVQRYLERSLPRTITQSDNIAQALCDITEALDQMQEKQKEQERRFRTNAESVANSISNLVRREITNINRINTDKQLESVHFGTISGIRIQASRVERMGLFLEALRNEPDLFTTEQTLEEAMAALYTRSNFGSIDGAQLLDYRNYVQVQIHVRRLAQAEWDSNIGASSGEGIGVGAAILVVILDALERQSETLLRRKIKGSIRFLMLDEANRLDTEALDMMASFCQATGVQLLVAAPEIAKARSGTTYCFVRRATSRGQEVEVTYRGRRGFLVDTAAP